MEYPEEFERECRWYSKTLKVVDPVGKVVPFKMRSIQKRLEYEVWKAREDNLPCFLLVLKARREGVSTWAAARFYRDTIERGHHRVLIMAHDDPATKNVLNMVRFFYKNDPKPMKSHKDSAAAIAFDNESEFFIYTAGARARAARSFNAQGVHFSELDYYPDPEVFDSVMQVTPNAFPTLVIIESTAIGPDAEMEQHWKRATQGVSGFKPMFFAWHDFEEYVRPLSHDDLVAFGPRAYIEANKVKILEEKDALGEAERVDGVHTRRAKETRRQGGGSTHQTATGPEGKSQPIPRPEMEGERTRGGGYLPDDPERRLDDLGESRDGIPGDGGGGLPDPDEGPRGCAVGRNWKTRAALNECRRILIERFVESLTEYEKGLIAEFDLTHEQLNWLRWVRAVKCRNDEVVRRREYPSRPEEAFEAASEVVLDPITIRRWMDESEILTPIQIHFHILDHADGSISVSPIESMIGDTLIWSPPDPDRTYVMGVDPSSGVAEGDWQVACVLDTETGEQVAEFRAKLDPDVAIDQIEALGIYYNKAFTGCEANSVGLAFARALSDRGTLPCFEREVPDRNEPWKKTNVIGWLTSAKTRDTLLTEVRKVVREGRCPIRSLETLREGRTLTVTRDKLGRSERIEARVGFHDDGIFAYGIALMMRNRQMPAEEVDEPIKKEEVAPLVQELLDQFGKGHEPLPIQKSRFKHVNPGYRPFIDKRRSVG